MAQRVALLPSEHGRGHLARMAVLARALADEGAEVLATPPLVAWLRDRDLASCASLDGAPPLDLGHRAWAARQRGDLERELVALRAGSQARVEGWQRLLARARAEVVVSDCDPAPLAAAARAGLPAIHLSNFTWGDFLRAWVDPLYGSWVDDLAGEATRALALPFATPLAGLRVAAAPVPHLGWPPARPSPPPLRERAAVLLALGFGHPHVPARIVAEEPAELWVPQDAPGLPALEGDVLVRRFSGPPAEVLMRVDLVLTKGGYSTVAEALAHRRPLLLAVRPDSPEDDALAAGLGPTGAARVARPAEEPALRLPGRKELERMAAAYDAPGPWARCDPRAVARAVLG